MRTPTSFNFNLIVDGGLYSWSNAGTANFPAGCGAADLFALEVFAAPDGAGIVYQRVVDISLAYATERYSWERKSIDAGATWSTWQSPLYGSDYAAISPAATPYAVVLLQHTTTLLVTTGAGAFVCNLPAASTVIGKRVTIIKIDSGAGAIQIAPNGADIIANAGNVSAYIGAQFRHITLQAQAAGQWDVVGGEWQPAQAVDTNGTHLSFGRLHHLPLNNTTARRIQINAAAGWSAAQQVTGLYGIPAGAKAVRAMIRVGMVASGPGESFFFAFFSDNNASSPSALNTAHPFGLAYFESQGVGAVMSSACEIDIPLNALGRFYEYGVVQTLTSGRCDICMCGYYMGD
jgi:hypothetical protein